MYVTIEYFVMYVGFGHSLYRYTLRNMYPVKNITKSHNLQCKCDYTFSELKYIKKILFFTRTTRSFFQFWS